MELLELYGPFVAAVSIVVAAFRLNFGADPVVKIEKYGFDIVVTKNFAGKIVIVFGAFSALSYYVFKDMSTFFPENLEMDVYYDEKGIEESLEMFSSDELSELGYSGIDTNIVSGYFSSIDSKLKSELGYNTFFRTANSVIQSTGSATFKVRKISGFHNYYVEESTGRLIHKLHAPNLPQLEMVSFFEKIASPSDYIKAEFQHIFLAQSIVIDPKFKQIVAEHYRSNGIQFDHILVCVTKIRLLPFPKFGNTIYFLESSNKQLTPVAYAVYK